jgi:para-aminobenzoate synthetase component 1
MLEYSHYNTQNNRFIYKVKSLDFAEKFRSWADQFQLVSIYDSHDYYQHNPSDFSYHKYDFLIAYSKSHSNDILINKSDYLNQYINNNSDWLFGYLSYDLKNDIHQLESKNESYFKYEDLFFYVPEMVLYKKGEAIVLESKTELRISEFERQVMNFAACSKYIDQKPEFKAVQTHQEYIDNVNSLKDHIQIGDIYEVNYCQEFVSENTEIDSWKTYKALCKQSPTPFAAYFRQQELSLVCASPERFVCKRGSKIVSQPIKGTIRMSDDNAENQKLITKLKNDPKEQSENVMIVDLVRNDLSQTAQKGSVKVEELFGIYPFKQLYQMISTVSSMKSESFSVLDVILSCFPMGSMTGAPKRRAMKLIDQYEPSRRSLFSGSVGYFDPEGDFDFNVIIRSLYYDASKKRLAYTVGGAITIKSDAQKEYDECLLKAKAIRDLFS